MSKRQLNVETLETEPPSAACISSLNLFDPVLLSARFLFDGIRNRLRSVTRHKWILYPRRINPSSPPISVDGLILKSSDVFGPPVNFEFLFSLPSSQKKEKRRQKKKIHVNLKRSQLTRRFFFSSKNVLNLNERSGECRFGWNTEIVEPRLTSRLREINERWRKRWSEHKGRKAIGKQEDYITSTIIKLIKGGSLYSLANPCLRNPCLNS